MTTDENLSAVLQLIEAHDTRYQERLQSLQDMMNMALSAQKELASRSETSFNARLEAMNHFREEFRTLIGTLATKHEVNSMFELIRSQGSRLDRMEGKSKGVGLAWSIIVAGVGLTTGIVSTVVVISKGLF